MDTDTNMDSQLLFYDMPRSGADVTAKPTSTRQDSFVFSDFELDPSLEITHNIQDLISKEGILFPDLLEDTSEPTVTSADHDVIKSVEVSPAQPDPMPEVPNISNCQVSENQASEVIVLSPEELSSLGFTLGLGGIVKSEENAEEVEVPHSSFEASAPEQTITSSSSTSTGKYNHKNTLKAEAPSKSISRRSRAYDKDSDEYRQRRERNNVAVRKSRDKAKHRQKETENRVGILTEENERLQKKVDLLTKELTVLKGLFTNVGAALPQKLAMLLK